MRTKLVLWASAVSVSVVLLVGCSSDTGSPGGDQTTKADPSSTELFDWSYGYLLKGDPEFTRMAPNYSTLRPFTRDTSLVIESLPRAEGEATPPAGQKQYFEVRLNKEMAVRFIVADSSGKGLITYEFATVPPGIYTLGSKGWPQPQIELTEGERWVYLFFVGDRRFRDRHRFLVDENGYLLPMLESDE